LPASCSNGFEQRARGRRRSRHGRIARTLVVAFAGFGGSIFLEESWSSGAACVTSRKTAATGISPFSPFNGQKVPEGDDGRR